METFENVPFRTEFWGICCESGKKYTQIVQKKVRITKAVLELPVKDANNVVTLVVERGDQQYLLCHLKANSILQADLNLYFDKGEEITFLIKGQGFNKVHVIGYHIYSKNDVLESSDKNHSISSIKKSNVSENKKPNIKEEEKISRKHDEKGNFNLPNTNKKKIQTGKPKFVKTEDTEDDSSEEESDNEAVTTAKKSLPVNVKNTKKKKNVDDSDEDDPFEELESTEDEEEEGLKIDGKAMQAKKRLWSSLTQDDDDDDDEEDDEDYEVEEEEEEDDDEDEEDDDEEDSDESDSDEEDVPKEIEKVTPEAKKMKTDTSTPSIKKSSPNVQTKPVKVVNLDSDSSAMMNSSIGRTPMPKKKQVVNADQANLSFQKSSQKLNSAKADASDSGVENSFITSPRKNENINATVPLSESKKKKKKKKSFDGLNNNAMETDTSKPAKLSLSSASYSQKLPGGLEYEDIRIGNGPVAKKGRLVHVYYTGMLQNNKVFDSRENNTKPFSFRLGAQSVIAGWDLGIEGMKVGGKRRLKIPPNLGYKNQKVGFIPPNSTLYFNVELKAVS